MGFEKDSTAPINFEKSMTLTPFWEIDDTDPSYMDDKYRINCITLNYQMLKCKFHNFVPSSPQKLEATACRRTFMPHGRWDGAVKLVDLRFQLLDNLCLFVMTSVATNFLHYFLAFFVAVIPAFTQFSNIVQTVFHPLWFDTF